METHRLAGLYFLNAQPPTYNYEEVGEWTARLTQETQGKPFASTFPRTSADITDHHHWNPENTNGWGGSSPEVDVANLYTNSLLLSADDCLRMTFEDPEYKYFTSITAYDDEEESADPHPNCQHNIAGPTRVEWIGVGIRCVPLTQVLFSPARALTDTSE